MINKNSKYMINKIERLYLDGNSIKTISKIINYDINRVYKIIKNLGITRTISEALTGKKATDEHKANMRNARIGVPNYKRRKIVDESKMIDMYVNQKQSSIKLAKIFNCSDVFVINILKKHNIDRRSNSENHKGKHFFPENEFKKGNVPWNNGIKIDRKKYPNMGHFQKQTKKSIDKMKSSTYHTNLNGKNSPKYINFEPYKEDMEKLYKQGLDTRQLAVLYNTNMTTIRHRFKKWNIKLRKSLYVGSKKLIADDGHKVKSHSELFIDNWLFHNGIIHVYEKRIGVGNFKTDFYIPEANIWIEYWGLQDVKIYRDKTKRKLEIYKSLGLNLLSIFPSDNIQKKLNFLLQYSQIQKPLEVYI